jgi:sugar O-acyltransferase (sialic acid O-acetyltransferase NeuD family)
LNKPIVVLGGGGHASVLVELLKGQNREILAVVSPDDISERRVFDGIRHLRNDDDLVTNFSVDKVLLVNGIGPVPNNSFRYVLNDRFLKLGYQFENVISPNAFVSPTASLLAGVQVLHGAIIQAGALVGENTIINTGAIVEHDCQIGINNHIGPSATLCGQVITENNVYVGASATIIQNIRIEELCVIGAGAIITRDLKRKYIAYGHRPLLSKKG